MGSDVDGREGAVAMATRSSKEGPSRGIRIGESDNVMKACVFSGRDRSWPSDGGGWSATWAIHHYSYV